MDWVQSSDFENAWDAQIAGLQCAREYRSRFEDRELYLLAARQYAKLHYRKKKREDPRWIAERLRRERNRRGLKAAKPRTRRLARNRIKYHSDESFRARAIERALKSHTKRRESDSDWWKAKLAYFRDRYHGDAEFRERVKSQNSERKRKLWKTDPEYRKRKAEYQREYRKRKRAEAKCG